MTMLSRDPNRQPQTRAESIARSTFGGVPGGLADSDLLPADVQVHKNDPTFAPRPTSEPTPEDDLATIIAKDVIPFENMTTDQRAAETAKHQVKRGRHAMEAATLTEER